MIKDIIIILYTQALLPKELVPDLGTKQEKKGSPKALT